MTLGLPRSSVRVVGAASSRARTGGTGPQRPVAQSRPSLWPRRGILRSGRALTSHSDVVRGDPSKASGDQMRNTTGGGCGTVSPARDVADEYVNIGDDKVV